MVVNEIFPNEDIITQWIRAPADGFHWQTIDENIAGLNTIDYICVIGTNLSKIDQFHMTTLSVGEVTQIKVWAYCFAYHSTDYIDIRTNWDTTWRNILQGGPTQDWYSHTYAGISKNQAELDILEIGLRGRTGSGGLVNLVDVRAMFVEVTYSVPPTGPSGIAKVYGIPSADIAKKYGVNWSDIAKIYGIE